MPQAQRIILNRHEYFLGFIISKYTIPLINFHINKLFRKYSAKIIFIIYNFMFVPNKLFVIFHPCVCNPAVLYPTHLIISSVYFSSKIYLSFMSHSCDHFQFQSRQIHWPDCQEYVHVAAVFVHFI